MQPQNLMFFCGELKHEVRRKSFLVSADLLVQPLRRDSVQGGQLSIQQHFLASKNNDRTRDALDWGRGCVARTRSGRCDVHWSEHSLDRSMMFARCVHREIPSHEPLMFEVANCNLKHRALETTRTQRR